MPRLETLKISELVETCFDFIALQLEQKSLTKIIEIDESIKF